MVAQLDDLVQRKKLGIVAHFYMDPELQGVLSALKWPHTFIADSLARGEAAVQMAEQGVRAVTGLGVDFMISLFTGCRKSILVVAWPKQQRDRHTQHT